MGLFTIDRGELKKLARSFAELDPQAPESERRAVMQEAGRVLEQAAQRDVLVTQLEKLVEAGNPERAAKLVRVYAKGTPMKKGVWLYVLLILVVLGLIGFLGREVLL
jgi:hypothetical protein